MAAYQKGQKVKWKWGSGYGHGKVKEVFRREVTRTIDGETITRHGSEDEPAYLINSDDANNVLKLEGELQDD